ncbi:MAG TPA: mechanosensitive ion channel family protein [Actinospica sp.]|nr:mechanosensitive ion channel family protein [Actinospica sp.]
MSSMHRPAPDYDRAADDDDPWRLDLSAIGNAISADFRRAVAAAVVALLGLALAAASGGVLGTNAPVNYFVHHRQVATVCAIVGAVLFFGCGVIAVRSATKEILKVVPSRLGDDRKVGLRWVCLVVGYLLVIFGTLGALNVPIERLAVGGAITGVILGIAAQQSLNNVFAGLVLLIVRPVSVGQRISLRSGPIGGPYTGEVEDMTLTYVRLATERGSLLLPNSTILTAVIGPPGSFDDMPPATPAAPMAPMAPMAPATPMASETPVAPVTPVEPVAPPTTPTHAPPGPTAPTSTEPPAPPGVAQQP